MHKIWIILVCVLLILILLIPGAVTVYASTYSTVVLASGPEAYYRLGESAGTMVADASGHSHSGTYSGGVTLGATGAIQGDSDTAITLDGTNDTVILPTLPFANTSFTIEFWMKPPAVASIPLLILSDWSVGHSFFLQFFATGDLAANLYNVYFMAIRVGALTFSQWNHIVYTYDNTVHKAILYLNGIEASTDSEASAFTGTNPYITFGSNGNYSDWYSGSLDELAIYWRPLSATEILQHYVAAGYSAPAPTWTPTATPTETLTPTPAPWLLATLPNGQTYQISYDIQLGDIVLTVIGLIVMAYLIFGILLKFIQR